MPSSYAYRRNALTMIDRIPPMTRSTITRNFSRLLLAATGALALTFSATSHAQTALDDIMKNK